MKKLSLTLLIMLFTLTSSIAWSNPGFKDLKPGILFSEVQQFCIPLVNRATGKFIKTYVECYGVDNIKFRGFGKQTLTQLNIDMGPIVASDGSFFSQLNNQVVNDDDEPNIYLKMKKNFDTKYVLDYEYSERDRQLFNEGEKDDLLSVYSNGQVLLRISRKERENSYSKDLWLYIEYRDVGAAIEFLEKNRPVISTLDDF